jgi:radical SAM protein with 4Fe4S-binding SPASM domain
MEFIDPNIARKNKLQNEHLKKIKTLLDGSPVFSHIEFSILGMCNRRCKFCPRVDPKVYPNINEFMPLKLYGKILSELREVNYTGGLSYSGFSEPLLHKDVLCFISLSKEILPDSRVEIITNGDYLTPETMSALFGAGLDTLLISMYDGPEQKENFEKIREKAGIKPERVILRERYLPPEKHYGITLSNRAGSVNLEELGVKALTKPMKNPCYYTHYRMMVDHTGDVLLCPHDWKKKIVLGNIKKDNIIDVWIGKKMNNVRKLLGSGDRTFEPCDVCDVLGTRQGGEHFSAWEVFYSKLGV